MKPNLVLAIFILCLVALAFVLFEFFSHFDLKSKDSSSFIQIIVWLVLSGFWFYNWRKTKTKFENKD